MEDLSAVNIPTGDQLKRDKRTKEHVTCYHLQHASNVSPSLWHVSNLREAENGSIPLERAVGVDLHP